MSDWEVKNSWQKHNGDWVLTVGPGVEPAGSIFGGTMVFCFIILEIIRNWGQYGAMALLAGMIQGMVDVVVIMVGFYQHFWLMAAWSLLASLTWAATFMKTPWIVKVPGFLALLWTLNQMLDLAKSNS